MPEPTKKEVGPITLGAEYTEKVHSRQGKAVAARFDWGGGVRVKLSWKENDHRLTSCWFPAGLLVDGSGGLVIPEEWVGLRHEFSNV